MKNYTAIILAIAVSFSLGFVCHKFVNKPIENKNKPKKVTGIGGIFFTCKDPEKMTQWYQKHLGLNTNPYGATFEWYQSPDSTGKAQTQWTPFSQSTKYFEPSKRDFMINYRVENLKALVGELKAEGVTLLDEIASFDYGKFVHILDGEGNKVELWEPVN